MPRPRKRSADPSPKPAKGKSADAAPSAQASFTDRQMKWLAALVATPTITKAAALSGISFRTLTEWLAEPAFRKEYTAACRKMYRDAVLRMQADTLRAAQALRRNLRDENGAV